MIQWLVTALRPDGRVSGYHSNSGWRLHAVVASDDETFEQVKTRRAACGLLPAYGWDVDLFIERPCRRCMRVQDAVALRVLLALRPPTEEGRET